jgi:hypothetical protein
LVASPSPDLEVVVQDNSSTDELGEFVSEMRDPRITYNWVEESLDVVANFTLGLEHAKGEFICFIGDDDGVLPEIVDAAKWADANGLDAVLPTRPAQYWWPDIRHRYYGDRFSGNLDIKRFSGQISFPDPEAELLRCARGAGRSFFDLPKVYYGLVRRLAFERVRKVTGVYFPGPSPDLAGAVAVASQIDRMCRIDYPFVLPGSSAKSTAGLGAAKAHEGRLEDYPHLPASALRDWSELVPRFFAGSTIWGEDVVQALRATGRDDVLRQFNVPLLHAMCAALNPAHLSATMRNLVPALRGNGQNPAFGVIRFAAAYGYTWALRFQSHLSRFTRDLPFRGFSKIGGLPDVERAVNALMAHMKETGQDSLWLP